MDRMRVRSAVTGLLPFVQLEFTHELGPQPGRYVVAAEPVDGEPAPQDVLMFDVVHGPAARRRRRRRSTEPSGGDEPQAVALAVVTHVKSGFADHGDAGARWVQACEMNRVLQARWIADAVEALNLAIRAHRASCADPYFPEVAPADARTARIGYGSAADITAGRWTRAFTVSATRSTRVGSVERSARSEVIAAALVGEPIPLDADELVLRAFLDLDQGRLACAALQLHAAARMLAAELYGVRDAPALERRLQQLPELIDRLGEVVADLAPGVVDDHKSELQDAAEQLRSTTDLWRAEVLRRFRAPSAVDGPPHGETADLDRTGIALG